MINEEWQYEINDKDIGMVYTGFFSYDSVHYDPVHRLGSCLLGRIKYQNKNYVYQGINGILGLGPSSFDNAFSESFLNKVIKYEGIHAVFSMCSDSETEGGGYLMLGGVDEAMYKGDILWFNYNTFRHYSIDIPVVKIGEVSIGFKLRAIVDTKFEFVIVDDILFNQIKREIISSMWKNNSDYKSIDGIWSDNLHILDGNPIHLDYLNFTLFKSDLPNLNLEAITHNIIPESHVLSISDYIVPWDQLKTLDYRVMPQSKRSSYYCSTIIKKFQSQTNTIYLGSRFLKSYYTVIDTQRARIGLAEKSDAKCIPSKITQVNSDFFFGGFTSFLLIVVCLVLFFMMITHCMEFYDLGEAIAENYTQSTDQVSQGSNTIDQRPEEQLEEENKLGDLKNEVREAIQFTQNDETSGREL